MSTVTKQILQKEIAAFLKNADLQTTSSRKVRQELESKLGCDLTTRKKEIDDLVMEYVNNTENSSDEDGSDSESGNVKVESKRTSTTSTTKKRKHAGSDDEHSEDSESTDTSVEEYKAQKTAGKGKKSRKAASSGSESDKPKKAKKSGAKGKSTGFTRPYRLSPQLAAIMGTESSPRHEVVKKVWSIIKERNLYDPRNKQYAICDSELFTVIGVKRFRTFGMLKYLKPHFIC